MKTLTTLLALIVMASPSFAATTKKVAKATSTKTTTTAAAATTATPVETTTYTNNTSASGPINWNAGFGLGTAGSQFHFGIMGNGMYEVANTEIGQFAVGGQTGFLFGPGTVTTWVIPVMAASQLTFKPTGSFVPYAGLSMGIGIFHFSNSTNNFFGNTATSNTTTDFAMFVKGGANFGQNQKYFAEVPFGTLGNAFSIIPSFGMKF